MGRFPAASARRVGGRLATLLLVATGVSAAVVTQARPQRPAFTEVLQSPSPAEGLETPLAAKLADRLGNAWFETAERTCADSRKLDAAGYRKLARSMLIAVGEHMQALAAGALDAKKADADFESRAGAGALQELKRLAEDPKVKRFLELQRLGQSVDQTSSFLENIERALLLARFQTRARASPISTGDDPALLIEMEKESGAALDYFDGNRGPELNRFLELMAAAADALTGASNHDALVTWGPGRLLPILEQPLKEHCIVRQ